MIDDQGPSDIHAKQAPQEDLQLDTSTDELITDPDIEVGFNAETEEPGDLPDRREINSNSGIVSAHGEPESRTGTDGAGQGRFTTGANLSQVTLGSALLALDKASESFAQARDMVLTDEIPERPSQSVLVPISEWQDQFGVSTDLTARYLALGMIADAREGASRLGEVTSRFGIVVATGLGLLWKPFAKSWPFSSLTTGFNVAVERGDRQVKHWIAEGRQVDARGRSIAQAALSQLADEAMDDVVENERIQRFIQEIVSAQSMGIVDEAIEEIRERTLSSDIFIEKPFRRLLGRKHRDEISPPQFDPEVVRPVKRQHVPARPGSLLGYYAGFMSRLFAFGLDIAFLAAFIAISSWLLSTTISLFGLEVAFASIREATSIDEVAGAIVITLTGVFVVTGYFVLFWVLTGQTLGMMILGLKVVNQEGRRLGISQGFVRLIGFLLSFLTLFLGLAWILIDDKREGWQDKLARSYVVYAWDANPDESFLYEYISGASR